MLETGSLLDGKYRILSEIGRGGMSIVYLAINESANKTWAVKEIRKDKKDDGSFAAKRLIAETEMLKKLRHTNLPAVVDVIDREDTLVIVMDYIEGNSLQDLLEDEGAQPPEKVIDWAVQLCDVLGYLHGRYPPIIYRDLKPSNVMLRPDGQVTLIDFGTAREYSYAGNEDTTWLGTRGYAAPEQFGGGGQTDGRTDLYNLGATMFHLLTGTAPVNGGAAIDSLGDHVPELRGSGLEKIIRKCCRQDPEERFQTSEELRYALLHVHEEDDRAVRRRSWRRRVFLACLTAALLFLLSGTGFTKAYAGTREEMYRKCMLDAAEADGFCDTAEACKKAMRISASNPEAWKYLAGALEGLPAITEEDYCSFMLCIRDTDSDEGRARKENLQVFMETEPDEYGRFLYRTGMALYFKKTSNGETVSRDCFRQALETKGLSRTERSIASVMFALADLQTKLREQEAQDLGNSLSAIRGYEIDSGYRECWERFDELAGYLEDLGKETGNVGYPIAVCELIADELNGSNIGRYARDGVDEKKMRSPLVKAKQFMAGLDRSGQTDNMRRRVNEVNEKIAQAEKNVGYRYYSTVPKEAAEMKNTQGKEGEE